MNKVTVPEGQSGNWCVERFIVDGNRFHSPFRRAVRPGEYTRLMHGDEVVMSDTPAEMRDHSVVAHKATGSVLINGLGLGMVLQACLEKQEVTDVTVIEKSADVIALVAAHYTSDPRVTIIHADAFEWVPPKGKRYNVVWHDIWTYISGENLPEMHKLHRKYGRRCDWQGSWARWECQEQMERSKKHDGLYSSLARILNS